VRSLLYYLYGPGKANEHTDPRLVAGFGDPGELEPDRLGGGRRDFRRLRGLLSQPLAALNGDNYAQPVWHCALRTAPEDRVLSDAEWARVAEHVMHATGLALDGDELGVRWVAVRHAPDHVHIVATLARQDRHRPDLWNSYRKLRRACRDSEEWFGLRRTAAADCTAAKRAGRAESEQAIRHGWDEPPRTWLRREVCTAAAGARTEQEFFANLGQAGVTATPRASACHLHPPLPALTAPRAGTRPDLAHLPARPASHPTRRAGWPSRVTRPGKPQPRCVSAGSPTYCSPAGLHRAR